jgi:basic membrane protein A and related proteins
MVGRNTDLHFILITAITIGLLLTLTSHSFQIHLTFAQQLSQIKVAFVTDGKFSDEGWGATGYNATQKLKSKYGIQLATADSIAIPDIESTLRGYADSGYNLIIAQGFQWGDPAVKVAADYPDVKFVIMTGTVSSRPNVASIFPMQQQGSFLLGALAAMMSKTGIIGFVGGQEYPNVINIEEGYKQGGKYINPNIKVLTSYVGEWNNPAKGKEIALTQINSGADFLLHVADTSGHGVIDAAQQKGVYAFGAVADQNRLAPNTVLTSFVLDMDKAYDQVFKQVQQGNFQAGISKPGLELQKGGSQDGIVYLASFHILDSKVTPDVKNRLKQITYDIINGKIRVPERGTATS